MELRAVFFDLDCCLVDDFDANLQLMNAAAREFGVAAIDPSSLRAAISESVEDQRALFFPGADSDILDRFFQSKLPAYISRISLAVGASETFTALEDRGMGIVVLTSGRSAITRTILEGKGLVPHALIASDDVMGPQPTPGLIFRGCEVLGIAPWEVLFVGGSDASWRIAAQAGCLFAGLGQQGQFTIDRLVDVVAVVDGAGPSN